MSDHNETDVGGENEDVGGEDVPQGTEWPVKMLIVASMFVTYILHSFPNQVEEVMEEAGKEGVMIQRDFASVEKQTLAMLEHVENMPMKSVWQIEKRHSLMKQILKIIDGLSTIYEQLTGAHAVCYQEKMEAADYVWESDEVKESVKIYGIIQLEYGALADREREAAKMRKLQHATMSLVEYVPHIFAFKMEKLAEGAGKKPKIPRELGYVRRYVPIIIKKVDSMSMKTIEEARKRNKVIQELLDVSKHLETHFVERVTDAYDACIEEGTAGAKELMMDEDVQTSLEICQIMFDQVDALAEREEQADKLAMEQKPELAALVAASIAAAPEDETPEAEAERFRALEAEAKRVKALKSLEEGLRATTPFGDQ